jgi:predicted TIM-barrel fold metal-dependent hydrolase
LYLGDNPDIDAYRKLVRLLGRDLNDKEQEAAENIAASIGEPTLLHDDSLSTFSRQLAKRLQPDGKSFSIPPTLGDLFRYIAWINLFRRLRSEITSELITLYGVGDSDAGRVQLFTTSFLDLENWLDERWLYPNGKPPYPRLDVENFHKQIELMELIANRNNGRLMPLAPFDPWRQALYRRKPIGQEPLEIVKNAVRNMGFVAVKIYPPMGFRPLGNAKLAADPTEEATCPAGGHVMDDELPHKKVNDSHAEHMENVRVAAYRVLRDGNRFTFPPKAVVDFPEEDENEFIFLRFGRALDDALHELYSWCSKEGVPIMTHCLNTQGPKHCYAGRSHPLYWEEVLELYPGLRVNLGHFGNMFALSESAPPKGNWAETVVEIAATYDGAYTDVGYFQHILYRDETNPLQCFVSWLTGDSDAQRVKNFAINLNTLLEHNQQAGSKVMYGSDWTMIGVERNASAYFRNFSKLLAASFQQIADAILGGNAAYFFGLTPKQQNRDRLERYYRDNGLCEALALLKTYGA